LQTLDRDDTVCYVGTFSKCLFPTLRLGYAVAPPWLRTAFVNAKHLADWHGDVLTQDTLAAFIAEGHLVRHVRHMRKVYAERRDVLLQALQRHGKARLQVCPSDAGLHLAAMLDDAVDGSTLAARAATDGINLEPLNVYAKDGVVVNGIAFGLGMTDVARINEGIAKLMRLVA
jgi:GntR family transcriptional regulator/MocR family aminotransferase